MVHNPCNHFCPSKKTYFLHVSDFENAFVIVLVMSPQHSDQLSEKVKCLVEKGFKVLEKYWSKRAKYSFCSDADFFVVYN